MWHALPFPRRINVELTNYCNQRCRFCPRQGFTRPLGFMSRQVFAAVASECAQYDTRLWLHFLGEPLLHRELLSFIALAREVGVAEVGLSTNAVSLHGKLAEGLLKSGLTRLECSLDANDPTTYAHLRGRDHFFRVVENIEGFLRSKRASSKVYPIVSLQVLLCDENASALPAIVERWKPWLGERDFVMAIVPAGFAGAIPGGSSQERRGRHPCHWLFEALVVLQDGTVTMCGADWDASAPLGQVPQQTLAEIWHGAELERRRELHVSGAFERLSPCANCEDWQLSDGSGYVNVLANPRFLQRAEKHTTVLGWAAQSSNG
jgi:MoaA/NifB/PqqE/SkfB family radical SAM enzyme